MGTPSPSGGSCHRTSGSGSRCSGDCGRSCDRVCSSDGGCSGDGIGTSDSMRIGDVTGGGDGGRSRCCGCCCTPRAGSRCRLAFTFAVADTISHYRWSDLFE